MKLDGSTSGRVSAQGLEIPTGASSWRESSADRVRVPVPRTNGTSWAPESRSDVCGVRWLSRHDLPPPVPLRSHRGTTLSAFQCCEVAGQVSSERSTSHAEETGDRRRNGPSQAFRELMVRMLPRGCQHALWRLGLMGCSRVEDGDPQVIACRNGGCHDAVASVAGALALRPEQH